MNNTQGGVNPSGYMGTGYGLSVNRLPVSTPQQPIMSSAPMIPAPVFTGGPIPIGAGSPVTTMQGPPPQVVGGYPPPDTVIQAAPVPSAPLRGIPLWHSFGMPQFHIGSTQAPALGVLGLRFGRTSRGWRVY